MFLQDKEIKTLIEYEGKQHYVAMGHATGEEKLKYTQGNDKIKRDFCKGYDIHLIEIPYWDFDNIEKILLEQKVIKEEIIK